MSYKLLLAFNSNTFTGDKNLPFTANVPLICKSSIKLLSVLSKKVLLGLSDQPICLNAAGV